MRTEEEDEKILRDGESIRVRLHMMDSVQRSIADAHQRTPIRHSPGYAFPHVTDAADAKRQTEHTLMVRSISDAWRGDEQPNTPPTRDEVFAAYHRHLTDAWRGA